MFKQNDPTLTIQVSDCAQNYMRVDSSGKYVASGGVDGSTTLFEICSGLYQIQPNEKQTISAIFERESKREKNLEMRARELRLKEKKGETAKGVAAGLQDDQDDVRIKECEQEFFEMVGSSMQKAEEASE
jgi:dynein intermediate chain 2, axonemal